MGGVTKLRKKYGLTKQMECKEVQKKIHCFVTDRIEERDIVPFIRHIEKCENCREELTIEYLVIIGLQRLDESGTFDLESELEDKIQKKLEHVALKRQVRFMAMTIALGAAVVAGYFFAVFLFY